MESLLARLVGKECFDHLDRALSGWMAHYGMALLRYSLALVFIWLGALKPLGMSPVEELVKRTVYFLPPDVFFPVLGWWEVILGIALLIRPLTRLALFLLFAQMTGTFLPLVVLPNVVWASFPLGLTMEGQYIFKNLVLISAAIVVGGTVREERTAPQRTITFRP